MFYGVPEDLELLLSTLKEEIKNELKIELGTGDPSKVQVGVLTLTKETNQLVNSLIITATAESENEIVTYIPPNKNETTFTSGNISEYFTYDKNGIAPITKVEYKTNGVTVDGTTTRALGGTITCTVTKANGATISKSQNINYVVGGNATEVSNNAEIYYGREITNYTPPNGDPDIDWRIYYADKEDNKIYLISNRCVNPWLYIPMGSEAGMFGLYGSCVKFANIVDNYAGSASITDARIKKLISWVNSYPTSTNEGIKKVAYLLDTELWNEYYKNTTYGDFAIGEPTLELFCKSYKDTHPSWYAEYLIAEDKYYVKWREYDEWEGSLNLEKMSYSQVFRNNDIYLYDKLDEVNGYWIAGMINEDSLYCVSEDSLEYSSLLGIRPIVCLQAGVQVVSNGDGTYALSK